MVVSAFIGGHTVFGNANDAGNGKTIGAMKALEHLALQIRIGLLSRLARWLPCR